MGEPVGAGPWYDGAEGDAEPVAGVLAKEPIRRR